MKWVLKLSLQQRIILSVALGLSVVLLVLAYAALWALNQSADATFRQRRELAQVLAGHVDDAIARPYEVLKRTATLPAFDLLDADLTPEKEILRDTQLQMGTFSTITLLDSAGNVLWAEPYRQGVVDLSLAAHRGALQVYQTGEPALAEFGVPHGQSSQVCLAAPVRSKEGTLTGVLMAEMHPQDEMLRLVPRSRAGDPTTIELVNGEGIVLGASYAKVFAVPSLHDALLPALKSVGPATHDGADGSRHIVAYAPLDSLPSWGVLVERHEDPVLALPGSLQQQMLIIGFLAVTVGVSLAWIDARRVVRPLGVLTAAAARMGAGDLDSPVTLRREDEIGVLASALESTRSKLKNLLEERLRWNEELERRVEQRTRELSLLLEAAEALSAILDPDELWEAIALQTRRLCPAANVALLVIYEQNSGRLLPRAAFGCTPVGEEGIRLAPGEGLLGKVFQSGWPVLIEDDALRRCEENLSEESRLGLRRAGADIQEASGAICVPLMTKQGTLGCLAVYAFQGAPPFTHNELRLLQAFAVQAAVAIENARLYDEVQRKEVVRGELLAKLITAQEEERHRIARELHDEPAQALTALMMAVESAEEALPQLTDAQKQRLERAKGLISRALGDVRRLIWDLRPTVLDDLGLAPAVRWFAEQHLEDTKIDVDVRFAQRHQRLPVAVETEVYRILQEAISNVAKHARATRLGICLGQNNGLLVAIVEDDGIGFDVDKAGHPHQQGLGLMGMRERARLLGGSLVVESTAKQGTRLTLNIPISIGGNEA